MSNQILLWVAFNIFVVTMLLVDLKVFHRQAHAIKIKEALLWSAIWIGLALIFNVGIYLWRGSEVALQFLAGYLVERSLSMDNLFVFLLIFSYFGVSATYQHKVLFWGILGAMIMRAAFIAAGVTLIGKFHWIIYLFGVLLIISGIKMISKKNEEIHPEKNPVLRLFRRFVPITPHYQEEKFLVKQGGWYWATPLFVVLLVIETTDVIFAVDSVPAVLAISLDPFIVYSSNIFAILGLRALYFALAGVMEMFDYLDYGLSLILVFVGAKMLLADFYEIPVGLALGVIAAILVVSIIISIVRPLDAKPVQTPSHLPDENRGLGQV